MKYPIFICFIFLLFAVFAQDSAKAQAKPLKQQPANVQVVNGKRFFSLQNVRRFNGSPNSPGALSVLHHPRGGTPGAGIRHNAPVAAPFSAVNTRKSKGNSDQVLSIFAPDEKKR